VSAFKVILRADVANVGKRGDICEVSDGYARNYLLPKGLAIKASDGAVAQAAAMRRKRDLRDAADRAAAEEIARTLVARTITITAKAGTEGRLFGSVTATDIVDAVEKRRGWRLTVASSCCTTRSRPRAATRWPSGSTATSSSP
jgi:large subunit ribosomal protein L9